MLAAREYYRVFELSNKEELETKFESGKVHIFSETLVGVIVDTYRAAANLFNEIGIKLEESGGGRVDILVRGVPVELKVEKAISDTREVIDKHTPQASQYASSQGKQVGILCVLDLTKRRSQFPPIQRYRHFYGPCSWV